jgi:ferredoxin-NADP reductase
MMPDALRAAPLRWREAVIERIAVDTPRVVSVFLPSLVAHQAGQHVDVRLTAPDGYQAQRSYSIASAPGAPGIELAIERLADGEVSPWFHDVAQRGDAIELRGPIGGHFIWDRDDGGPLLLVGGGSGIVPLMSIARHRAIVAPAIPALLVYSSRTWDDIIYRDELIDMQRRDAAFGLVLTTTREPRRRAGDFDRRVDGDLLRERLAQWGQAPRHVYVCGSNAFVESVTSSLVHAGMPAARIRAERYGGAGA